MLGWRLFLSAVLIPALFGLFYLDARSGEDAPFLLLFCLLLAIRGSWELADLLRTRSFEPGFRLTALLCCILVFAGWCPWRLVGGEISHSGGEGWESSYQEWEVVLRDDGGAVFSGPWECVSLVFVVAILLLFLKGAVRYRESGKSMETLGSEILIVSYIGLLLAVTAQLRWVLGPGTGYLALGSLIIAAKSGDVGAYTLGRMFGKKKMVPLLSPGKTWMGALGAVLGAGLGSWLWFTWGPALLNSSWSSGAAIWTILFGVIIGVVGLIGDLCESLIKRDVGRKDSAALLPGFGGVLDLLDSVLYTGPVAYILWKVLPLVR